MILSFFIAHSKPTYHTDYLFDTEKRDEVFFHCSFLFFTTLSFPSHSCCARSSSLPLSRRCARVRHVACASELGWAGFMGFKRKVRFFLSCTLISFGCLTRNSPVTQRIGFLVFANGNVSITQSGTPTLLSHRRYSGQSRAADWYWQANISHFPNNSVNRW